MTYRSVFGALRKHIINFSVSILQTFISPSYEAVHIMLLIGNKCSKHNISSRWTCEPRHDKSAFGMIIYWMKNWLFSFFLLIKDNVIFQNKLIDQFIHVSTSIIFIHSINTSTVFGSLLISYKCMCINLKKWRKAIFKTKWFLTSEIISGYLTIFLDHPTVITPLSAKRMPVISASSTLGSTWRFCPLALFQICTNKSKDTWEKKRFVFYYLNHTISSSCCQFSTWSINRNTCCLFPIMCIKYKISFSTWFNIPCAYIRIIRTCNQLEIFQKQ